MSEGTDKLMMGAFATVLAGAAMKVAARSRSGAAPGGASAARQGEGALTAEMLDVLVRFPEFVYRIEVPPHARARLESELRAVWHARDARQIALVQQVHAYAAHCLTMARANPTTAVAMREGAENWLPVWQVCTALDSPYSLWVSYVIRITRGLAKTSRTTAEALRAGRSEAARTAATNQRAAVLTHLPPPTLGSFIP